MFRYDSEAFSGLTRDAFRKALKAEGIPSASGYAPLNKEPFLKAAIESRGYKRLFSGKRLREWVEQNQCPANDKLCSQAVWFTQNMLLGPRSDMDQIAGAIRKIQANSRALAKG
jgi:dTDP-4-amino-4,6-dideoxygalactose transaminase